MMWAKFFMQRVLVIGGVAVVLMLLSGSHAEAGGRVFRAWTTLMMSFERVCGDGVRFGMANTGPHTYRIVFVPRGQGIPTANSTVYGEVSGVELKKIEGNTFANPYCMPVPINTNSSSFVIKYCDGTIVAYFDTYPEPNMGALLDVYVYILDFGGYVPYGGEGSNVFPVLVPYLGWDGLNVSDCYVDELDAAIVQTETGTAAKTISEDLVFQVNAHDPNWGTSDGEGISRVHLEMTNADGATVNVKDEYHSPFCLREKDGACASWNFAEHDYLWPNGLPIVEGSYIMTATAYGSEGRNRVETKEVEIQFAPRWEGSLYLPNVIR